MNSLFLKAPYSSLDSYSRLSASLRLIIIMSVCLLFSGCVTPGQAQKTASHNKTLSTALRYADKAYQNAQWPLAVRRYQKVVSLWPEDGFGFFRLGNAQLQIADIDGAIYSFETAIRLSPNDAKAYNNLSIAYLIRSQDLLMLLNQKLRSTDVSARRSVQQRLQLLDQVLATPVLGVTR